MKVYENIHEAYLGTLSDVYDNPDSTSAPRGQRVREKFNYQFTVLKPTTEAVVTEDLERNKTIVEYSKKEFDLYSSGSNLAEDFGKASKFWLKLANPDGTVNSAYGYLIKHNKSHGSDFETAPEVVVPARFEGDGSVTRMVPVRRTPWEWAKASLLADKDTRQAILRFSLPEHQWMGNKDQTCTLHGLFMIRDNKLNLTINMRSNDLTLGLVYDLPWFQSLIFDMREELKEAYPDLEIGTYTHYVHNIHVYDRDEDKILKMLGRV
jgi:thymidylate synthase